MDISFIIPMYNAENTINKTINSIVKQNNYNFEYEIIIVDDGSIDNSIEKVNESVINTIKLFKKKNGGTASARNYGLEQAIGKYVMFVDADDEVAKNLFEVLNKKFDNNTDVLLFGFSAMYDDYNINNTFSKKSNINSIILSGGVWNKIYKKDTILFHFNEKLFFEDIYFLFEYIINNQNIKIQVIDDILYLINRTLEDNKMSNFKEDEYMYVFNEIEKLVRNQNKNVKKIFSETFFGVALLNGLNLKNKNRLKIIMVLIKKYNISLVRAMVNGSRKDRKVEINEK